MIFSTVRKLCFITILFIVSFNLSAQRFDNLLSKLNTEYPQEKLYLHYDRSAYNPGEIIWFKAYLFAGNYISQISKNIYFELLDSEGKVLQHKISPVTISSSASYFQLPENINSSFVYVRAYTKWMLNFDSAFLYHQPIRILNTKVKVDKPTQLQNKNVSTPAATKPSTTLNFFPEGGDLVEDVESRIAFKATDNNGLPVNVKGNIVDVAGKKIMQFSTVHNGMGSVLIVPKASQRYKAVWTEKSGTSYETELPMVNESGVVLEVNSLSNQIEFKIKRSVKTPNNIPFVYVVAHINQELLYRAKADLTKKDLVGDVIPTTDLPAGIVHITLFTPGEKPIAERIVFVNQHSASFITDLNAPLKDLGKRKKNVIQIDVPDTIVSNLSVAVTDAELNPVAKENNILSNILLTSEIKGYVHDPAYYFSSDADSVADHLDLVMMTNGWRRFNWERVLAGDFSEIVYKPEPFLAIEGQVLGLNKTLLQNKEINAIVQLPNGSNAFLNTSLQADGKFTIPDMIFYDTAKFYYQFNNDKNHSLLAKSNFVINTTVLKKGLGIKPADELKLRLPSLEATVINKNKVVYEEQLSLAEMNKVKVLKEVKISGRPKSQLEMLEENHTSGLFKGGDARIFVPEEGNAARSAQNLLQYLQSVLPGLFITNTSTGISLNMRQGKPQIFIDEWIREANDLRHIWVSDVSMVKVFNRFLGSYGNSSPAIVIYMKRGYGNSQIVGLNHINVQGYSPIKEFYSPDYSTAEPSSLPDYRSTLYWNPYVVTDKEHRRITIPFFNNDITKKITVIIEGCNVEGKLTRIEKVFQ